MPQRVSPHDYRHLLKRWRTALRPAGLRLRPLCPWDGESLFYVETPAAASMEPVYISAGVHGDEPGSTEALLAWVEQEADRLRDWPLLLFPCLNPWGLRHNVRTDQKGADLNRCFHTDHAVVAAVKKVVRERRLRLSLHLHEDYDAEGMYVYELSRRKVWGEALLEAARPWMPADPRKKIDISRAQQGIVRRKVTRKRFAQIGYPEAIWLFFEHTDHTFTIETPSEFALERRVAAHVAALGEMAKRVLLAP